MEVGQSLRRNFDCRSPVDKPHAGQNEMPNLSQMTTTGETSRKASLVAMKDAPQTMTVKIAFRTAISRRDRVIMVREAGDGCALQARCSKGRWSFSSR